LPRRAAGPVRPPLLRLREVRLGAVHLQQLRVKPHELFAWVGAFGELVGEHEQPRAVGAVRGDAIEERVFVGHGGFAFPWDRGRLARPLHQSDGSGTNRKATRTDSLRAGRPRSQEMPEEMPRHFSLSDLNCFTQPLMATSVGRRSMLDAPKKPT